MAHRGTAEEAVAPALSRPDLRYSDGIAGARTMIALRANPEALQSRLPDGWELAPYEGDDLRGTVLRGATMLVPFHEVYAVRTATGDPSGLEQVSYVAFISQARDTRTGALGHVHWFSYTEDPGGVPGKYGDAQLARISRSQAFVKERVGETRVVESFAAVASAGVVRLSLAYQQGNLVRWVTAEEPNLPLYAAKDPGVVRWYQEDQVVDVARSDPLGISRVSEVSLEVKGELADVFDGSERVVAVVIQRPYVRHVHVPQ